MAATVPSVKSLCRKILLCGITLAQEDVVPVLTTQLSCPNMTEGELEMLMIQARWEDQKRFPQPQPPPETILTRNETELHDSVWMHQVIRTALLWSYEGDDGDDLEKDLMTAIEMYRKGD